MAADPVTRFFGGGWRPRPWTVLLIGVGVTLLGLLLSLAGDSLAPLRVIVLFAGLITVGSAVSLRLRRAGQEFEERMESAGVLAVAAFAALLAYWATDAAWDSMTMGLVVLIIAALAGVVLILLPTAVRMGVVGVLVLVHFGGMITAATTIDPPGSSAPWVSLQAWLWYRPYLQFMYLNNAYHFYSPEPGPPALIWFHIKYKDGHVKWVKIPHRDDDPVPIHHTRLLSVTESASIASMQQPPPQVWDDLITRREGSGRAFDIPLAPPNVMPVQGQYQETQDYSLRMQQSYVRHIAILNAGAEDDPIMGIKVYRLRHTIMNPEPMAEGRNLLDPTLFIAFYQGEYDKDGNLLHVKDVKDAEGNQVDVKDPFRFWYMPIYYQSKDPINNPYRPDMKPDELELVDCLTRHARLDILKAPSQQQPDPTDSPWDDRAEKPQP